MINTLDRISIKKLFLNTQNFRSIQILDIHSKKAKNLLRGVDSSSYNKTKNTLDKIKLNCKQSDYKKALLYVRSNLNFEGNHIGQFFNERCPKGLSNVVEYSPSQITKEIDNYADELIAITNCATDIFNFLKESNLEHALDSCDKMVDIKGTSVFLIRMLSFITNRYQLLNANDKNLSNKIDKLKLRIGLSETPVIEEAVTQLSNLRTSHLAICKRINDFKNFSPNGRIAKSFINPIPRDLKELTTTLSAFFAFSLFDAFLYLKLVNKMQLPFVANILFNKDLSSAYMKLSAIEFDPKKMYEGNNEYAGYYYLRECFLISEQFKAFSFLSIHSHYYSDFTVQQPPTPFAKNLIDNYFSELHSLTQLRCSDMSQAQINWGKYDSSSCGMLENSSALIHLLTKKQGQLDKKELSIFIKLMSFSRDIGEICPPDYLECISNSSTNNQLLLVASCLVTINKKNTYTEHQLRTTIQKYCLEEFEGDLNKLLEFFYRVSPAVTEHLIRICNETFLSTLFHLMEKPIDALELRANILHWYGEQTGEEHFLDRAKTLRIDMQINKEKDTIDDSRIYVDPLKFSQWFEDNMVNDLTMVLDNIMISNTKLTSLNWGNRNTTVGNAEELMIHLLACYNQFCSNRIFGIASYLGRRIRHGTFKGTAVTELRKLQEKDDYINLFEVQEFKVKFNDWLNQYEGMIDDLVNTSLQIKSKRKPSGLITTEIDSSVKINTADQLVFDILDVYAEKDGVIRLPTIIIDYCWRLVQYDLEQTKKILSEKKSSYGVFSYTPKGPYYQQRKEFLKFSQEVNSITTQKFALMASWFNKPSYASPSTDIYLLFNAVVSEVKDNVNNFEPKIDLNERIFTVDGGAYYVIYDALYILIHNVACHGKPNGKMKFLVANSTERKAIKLELTNELESVKAIRHANEQINLVLDLTDENAHIVEGKSGIKKLKKLESEGSISSLSFRTNEKEKTICFEFLFELMSRGK